MGAAEEDAALTGRAVGIDLVSFFLFSRHSSTQRPFEINLLCDEPLVAYVVQRSEKIAKLDALVSYCHNLTLSTSDAAISCIPTILHPRAPPTPRWP